MIKKVNYEIKFCAGLGTIYSQTLTPKNAQSCEALDIPEIENCYSNAINQEKKNLHAECGQSRTVNIVITILATTDAEREAILNALNDPNLVTNINAELSGEDNDIGTAGIPEVVSTGNLIH